MYGMAAWGVIIKIVGIAWWAKLEPPQGVVRDHSSSSSELPALCRAASDWYWLEHVCEGRCKEAGGVPF